MNESAAINYEPEQTRATRPTDAAQVRLTAIAAARRVITRDGAGRMTLDSVGHEAGLPMGALASHFDNEQELLMAVAAEDLGALAKSMRSSTPSAEFSPNATPPDMIERVEVLETAFASMIGRHQKALNERNDIAAWVEQSVKALQQQVGGDFIPTRLRPDAKAPAPQPATPPDPPLPAKVARLIVEPPPVAAVSVSQPAPIPPAPVAAPPAPVEVSPAAPVEVSPPKMQFDEPPPVLAGNSTKVTSTSEEAVHMDNYLLEARRAAQATQAGSEKERNTAQRRSKRTRVVAVAFLGPLAILASAAMVLNRNVVTAEPASQVAPTPAQVAEIIAPAPVAQAPIPAAPEVTAAAPVDPAPAQVASTEPADKLAELAASGNVQAERDLGLKYLAGDGVEANESEAARWLMRAAYRGEPTAEYWLGTLYARGHGVPADAFQANHWYEAAAQKGNRRAMHSFAVAYFQGWGVEKNYSEAARWFRSAADLGFVDSQFNLAVLYERGAGIPQSLTEAYKWYAIASQGGDKESGSRVAILATQLAPADLALAQQAAASFKPAPMDKNANLATDASSTEG